MPKTKPSTTKAHKRVCTQGKCRRPSCIMVAATGERYCGPCWLASPESKPRVVSKRKTKSIKRKVRK